MRIPLSWLKEYVDVPVEADRLAQDLTLAGLELGGIERDGKDAVLDLEITTNRVDCMNVYGVAREVSALYGTPLRPLDVSFDETAGLAQSALRVKIEAPDLCPRFAARVLDVRLGPSPAWLRERLEAVGVRPINNVVDLSNYVMMEMGQPTHAFDLARIPGAELRIRWARAGERLTTLDGVERALIERCGVVASQDQALALAGVMGGASSEVSDSTRAVALEAAYWNPLVIRRSAKALGMHTEASHRFERGADPEGPIRGLARVAHLLVKTGAGSVRRGIIDEYVAPVAARRVVLRLARPGAVLGVAVPEARTREILGALGFAEAGREGLGPAFVVPSWRGDVAREIDLIEEVGRHFGLQRIPATIPPSSAAEGLRPAQRRERVMREVLVAAGLDEAINYAFVSDKADPAPAEGRVRLANPLSEDQNVLRTSLVAPGLLTNLKFNLHHGRKDVRLFEIGSVFTPGRPLPREERHLGILLFGAMTPPHWSDKGRGADLFDLKGIVEHLGRRLGVAIDVRRSDSSEGPGQETRGLPTLHLRAHLHPGQAAGIYLGTSLLGVCGSLHPDTLKAWDLRGEALVLEMSLDPLLAMNLGAVRFRPLDRQPFVERDLSVVCALALPSAELIGLARGAAGEWAREVDVTDRYSGPPIAAGKVNYTITLRFQHPERTLTGEEVQASVERVAAALRLAGVELRG